MQKLNAKQSADEWTLIGKYTPSASPMIDSGTIPVYKRYRVMILAKQAAAAIDMWLRINNDSAANYGYQGFFAGSSARNTASNGIAINPDSAAEDKFITLEINNGFSAGTYAQVNAIGNSTAVQGAFVTGVYKVVADITRIQAVNTNGGNLGANSYMLIYGSNS